MNAPEPAIEQLKYRLTWEALDHNKLEKYLSFCLDEEIGASCNRNPIDGDLTTRACGIQTSGTAFFIARQCMVLCGLELIPMIQKAFCAEDLEFAFTAKDGDTIGTGDIFLSVQGRQDKILLVERTVLNFLQRLSGVATATQSFVEIIDTYGVHFLDTRKTSPGLRQLEKYATACGGGYNHRMGLHDRILIKDNHLAAASIDSPAKLASFLEGIRKRNPSEFIEVEVDSLEQFSKVINSGVNAALLDNFSPSQIKQAVEMNDQTIVLEASGGINQATLESYAEAKPHFISSGAPVHASQWIDIGLDWN